MAQKVQVVLTCDLDDEDTPAVDTVTFAYDGQTYEFELCSGHLDEFHKVMQGYVASARPAGARRRTTAHRAPARAGRPAATADLAAVRQWARAQGYQVSDRGRVPATIREAFEAAQH